MPRNRRQFIRGRWTAKPAKVPAPGGTIEIASILVQTRPERLAAAEAAIRQIDAAEVYQRDEKGKIVVVVEALDSASIGETLTRISVLPDVISATLVYHATDSA